LLASLNLINETSCPDVSLNLINIVLSVAFELDSVPNVQVYLSDIAVLVGIAPPTAAPSVPEAVAPAVPGIPEPA
jgi:hypothetical protein